MIGNGRVYPCITKITDATGCAKNGMIILLSKILAKDGMILIEPCSDDFSRPLIND